MPALHTILPFVGADFSLLMLLGIGFAVGVLAGFFGVGGGWVVTPALYALGFPMPYAIGTGLAGITAQGALATVRHRRMGNVDYGLGLTVGASMVGGLEAGKRVVNWLHERGLSGPVVGWVYVVLLTALGAYMVRDYLGSRRHARGDALIEGGTCTAPLQRLSLRPMVALTSCGIRVSLWVLVGLGLLVGLLAGLLGCGGGFVLVPAFVYLIGTTTLVAVGSSLLCVLVSGAYGTYTYGVQGSVEIVAALWMFAGSVVGANLGAAATRYVRGLGIRALYAVMLLTAAGGLSLKQLSGVLDGDGGLGAMAGRLSPVAILGGALVMCLIVIGRMVMAVLQARRSRGQV